jgi:hypothetical protein
MDCALVVLEYSVLLLGKRVWLESDGKYMSWLRRSPQVAALRLVKSLHQVKLIVTPPSLLPRTWVETSRFLGVQVPQDELVKAVDGLTLVFCRPELTRVQAKCVVRTTGVLLVGPVEQRAGPPPTSID